ncbi:MAG: site-specific integrase [Betaproteobacteria bacterium]|jgi:integrase|nr:site-specific integrase [Betaproteobacteria bacterium]
MSLYKRTDSPRWWVKISHGGRTIQRSTGTEDKTQAKEYHDKLKVSLWEQQRLGVKPRRAWKEAVVRWLAETSDKATHDGDIKKLRWLDAFLGKLMLDEITLDVIDRVKSERLKTVSKSTVNRYLAVVRSILLRARDEWEWIDKAPKVKLFREPPGRERSITVEQAEALLRELPAHQRDVVLFTLATGLRQSNVLRLEWSHVNLESGHAWVDADQSKNRRAIAVPLNSKAVEVLRRQVGKHAVRVFTYAGRPLDRANTHAWQRALKRAGIENFRWHDLRHTWATWHRQSGTPTHELQRLGGWRTSVMVERYAHLAPDHLATAANRLDSMLGGYDLATLEKKKGVSEQR